MVFFFKIIVLKQFLQQICQFWSKIWRLTHYFVEKNENSQNDPVQAENESDGEQEDAEQE